jgi:hypothetical protein
MQICWAWLPFGVSMLATVALGFRLGVEHYIRDDSKPFSGLGWNRNWRRRNFDANGQRRFTWLQVVSGACLVLSCSLYRSVHSQDGAEMV